MEKTPNTHFLVRNNPSLLHHTRLISKDEVFLQKIQQFISLHLDTRGFRVEDVARHIHLSVSQLNRKLNDLVNKPAGKIIMEIRLQHAANLLAHNTGSIGEIAEQTGFHDQAHFCRSFKQFYDCTPSEYKERNGKKGVNQ